MTGLRASMAAAVWVWAWACAPGCAALPRQPLALSIAGSLKEAPVIENGSSVGGDGYRFRAVPAPLARLEAVHPRLYLTAEGVASLKGRVGTEPYVSLLNQLRRAADRLVAEGPPSYVEDGGSSGEQQLYQRRVGDAIPNLALAYLLTGESRYLAAARAWMVVSTSYPTWGIGRLDGMDLAAGHQLYGLALGYDWLYHDLDEQTRGAVRSCLRRRGRQLYEALLNERVYWHRRYLQNHQWINMTGLAAAGLALYGEVEGIDGWIVLPLAKFRVVMGSLGPDGASHEGLPYWSYGIEYLLKFMDLARGLLGEDFVTNNKWFEHTASFRLYSMLPRESWERESSLMTFADGPRRDFYGPDYVLRKLATEYQDGHAQWLANELRAASLCHDQAIFLNLLWADPSVVSRSPSDLPTFKHFDDLNLVFMRSSWDGDEALLAFKCGPHIGHHAVARYSYDPGGSHVHPDAGSCLLFAHGDWLLVDDGYALKKTEFHNTAVVNGIGQEGEGQEWFEGDQLCAEKRGARILLAEHSRERDYVIGDATQAYPREAGLTRFLRHVLYARPDSWIIVDELEAASPSTFELHFHADFPFEQRGDRTFVAHGKQGALRLTVLAPAQVVLRGWRQSLVGTDGKPPRPVAELEALTVANPDPRQGTLFVTVLETYPVAGGPPDGPTISDQGEEKTLTLHTREGARWFGLRPGVDATTPLVLVELPHATPPERRKH